MVVCGEHNNFRCITWQTLDRVIVLTLARLSIMYFLSLLKKSAFGTSSFADFNYPHYVIVFCFVCLSFTKSKNKSNIWVIRILINSR